MKRISPGFIRVMAFGVFLAAPRFVFAQDQPTAPAPYRATFGGAWTDNTFRRALELSSSILEGVDNTLLVDTLGQAPTSRTDRTYTSLIAGVDFRSSGDTVQVRAGGGTNLRYYPSMHDEVSATHYQTAGLSVHLPARTTVTLNESAAYAPSFLYDMFPTAPAPTLVAPAAPTPAADYSLTAARFYTLSTDADVTTNLSRRAAITATAGLQRTNPIDASSVAFRTSSTDYGAHFSYGLSRTATLRVGYQTRDVTLPNAFRLKERNFDLGVDYHRALSRSRRTTIAFTGSTTSFTGPVYNAPNAFAQEYGFSADAALGHRFRRTWNVTGVYHRGISVIDGFELPLFTDAVSANVTGFLARRVDLSGNVGYSLGNSILVASRSRLATSTADVKLRYAVNRTLATFVEYAYYRYDFDRNLNLPAGVTPRLQSGSLRVGLTVWTRAWSHR